MAKNISFTAPPAAITDLAATPQSGGALADGTTYYYVVVAVGVSASLPAPAVLSGISNEVFATCDASNKTVRLDWTAVPGAVGYAVFRATSADGYGETGHRFHRYTDNNGNYVTTTNNYYVDAGAATPVLGVTNAPSVYPASLQIPLGLAPRTYGIGKLIFDGGTALDPITPQNIYDYMVAAGFGNYVKWDGTCFGLLGHFLPQTAETHFYTRNTTIVIAGKPYIYSTNAASELIFGDLVNGVPTNGCLWYFLGSGSWWPLTLSTNAKFYDCRFVGANQDVPFYLSSFESGINLSYAKIMNCEVMNFLSVSPQSNYGYNGLFLDGNYIAAGADCKKHSNIKVAGYIETYFYSQARLDKYTVLGDSNVTPFYQINLKGTSAYFIFVDALFPYCRNTNGYPVINWPNDASGYVDLWQSLQLLVTDAEGNPLSGAAVTIKDKVGATAQDLSGTDIAGFTTDASGRLWREQINITGATANSITDSSKAWTASYWIGRNVVMVDGAGKGQVMKVLSNTADTLTFTEAFVITPGVGDKAGIILEVKRVRFTFKAGSGAGYGEDHTTTTEYTPHTITISKSGYANLQEVVVVNRPMELLAALDTLKSAGSPANMGLVPLGTKQVAL